jgi:ATP-dependent Lon protease
MDRKKRRNVKKVESPPAGDGKSKTHRYNLRSRKEDDEDVRWIDDAVEEEEDSDYTPSEEEEEESEEESEEDVGVRSSSAGIPFGLTLPPNVPITLKIQLGAIEDDDDEEEYEEDEEEDEDDEEADEFLASLLERFGSAKRERQAIPFQYATDPSSKSKTKTEIVPALKLNREERAYFEDLSKKQKKVFNGSMDEVSKHLTDHETPFKFQILQAPLPPSVKASVIKKIDAMHRMGPDSGEAHKLKTWVDAFLRIPFGKQIPLPVSLESGFAPCSKFLTDTQATLDGAVYGMHTAKTQIMQVIAQWIANPSSVGNVIALRGPMGVGKTSFARNGIAAALKRPFQFFSLGGASDVAHYVGHSYTYEGSMWGRIADAVMQAGCMNPVFYFDELDKVSGTPHGDEIVSMLIHLTDRSQNMQYHDRYFAGVDFDLSQCLFVFSFNDESKVHPVLKDRMSVIQCAGYTEDEKKIILSKYVWPDMLNRFKINPTDILVTEDAVKSAIRDYSANEEGVRNLIRAVETLVMRINLLRIADKNDPATKALKFYMDIQFPLTITPAIAEKLLSEVPVTCAPTPFGMYV